MGTVAPPLIGRSRERGSLEAVLDALSTGRGHLVLVGGEPGVGKTRLLEEVENLARRRDHGVVWANCWQGEGAPPLWPWTQVLRPLAEHDLLADTDLVAQITEGGSETGLLGDVDPAGARFRLFERVVANLHHAAAQRPLVLVVDDLHWADRSSLQLLLLLAPTLRSVSLTLVGAYRDTEVGPEHPLGQTLAALSRDAERISLTGLVADEVTALATATAGTTLEAPVLTTLHDHTGGNPFFVKELVRLLLAQGRLGETVHLPAGVREVLDRRLARLSQQCQQALAAAAVIGRDVDPALLADVDGLDPDTLDAVLDEAVTARVITETSPNRFSFVHDLFRQALYEGLGRARRLRLHLAVGDALESRHRDRLDDVAAEVAHHLLSAASIGDPQRAIDHARRAAERAVRQFAYDEAVRYYERAIAVLPAAAPAAQRASLLFALGDARWRAQDIDGARTDLATTAALARDLGDAQLFARAAMAFACGLGGNQAPTAQADRALIDLLEEALDRLPADDHDLRCRVESRLAVELYLTDQVDRRAEMSANAVAMARRLDEPGVLATALYGRQIAVFGPDGLEDREAVANEILALAERAGDLELAFWGHMFRVWTRSGQCLSVADELAVCTVLADRLGLPGCRAEVAMRLAVVAVVAGRIDEANRLLGQVHGATASDPAAAPTLMSVMMLLAYLRGPVEAIEPMLTSLLAEHPDRRIWRAARTALYAELSRFDELPAELAIAARWDFDVPRDGVWLFAMSMFSLACVAVGDAANADVLYPMVVPHAGQAPLGGFGSMAGPGRIAGGGPGPVRRGARMVGRRP